MASTPETDEFLTLEKKKSSSESNTCYSKWWDQVYHSQKIISQIIESFYFHVFIIFLVVADTSLIVAEVILDSFKIEYECQLHVHRTLNQHDKIMKERVELAMEIIHYTSIAILTFFVIELFVKIYAFGKEFWNIRRRKMEYFDAFIVISSLIIDLVFLSGEEKILGKKLLLVLSFRLWRFVRIISSVSEAIIHGQTKHKEHLNKHYLNAIHRLVDLFIYKTNYTEKNSEDVNLILEHFRMMDERCQTSLDSLQKNHILPSSLVVAQFIKDLNRVENINVDSVISTMFRTSPKA